MAEDAATIKDQWLHLFCTNNDCLRTCCMLQNGHTGGVSKVQSIIHQL
jgi:hypothetical protein